MKKPSASAIKAAHVHNQKQFNYAITQCILECMSDTKALYDQDKRLSLKQRSNIEEKEAKKTAKLIEKLVSYHQGCNKISGLRYFMIPEELIVSTDKNSKAPIRVKILKTKIR